MLWPIAMFLELFAIHYFKYGSGVSERGADMLSHVILVAFSLGGVMTAILSLRLNRLHHSKVATTVAVLGMLINGYMLFAAITTSLFFLV